MFYATPETSIPATEGTVQQFNRLIQDLLKGGVRRNQFQPWEILLLLDMDQCELPKGRRYEILRRYQKAANRRYEDGVPDLLKLSEYLNRRRERAA